MTLIAPALQGFFTDRLIGQHNASPHTIAAYRDTLRLLRTFASQRTGKPVSQLRIDDLGPGVITGFLDHLEGQRGNSVPTRNARLAAIHSLFRYAALHHPDHAATIQQVLAIPPKRYERTIVTFLTEPEIDALLTAPDCSTWTGRRDHALLVLAIQTGLRVSELTSLTDLDVHLGTAAHVGCWDLCRRRHKSHLLIGLGLAACEQGRRVRYITTAQLVNELVEAADERVLSRVVARYGRLDLLCLDELGYVQIDPRGAELLFQIITEREERASVAIATNLPFSEWGTVFPDPRLVAAIVDRVTFNAHILETGTKSYRLRTSKTATRAKRAN